MNGHDFTLEQNTEARMMLAVARRGLAAAINDAENGIGHGKYLKDNRTALDAAIIDPTGLVARHVATIKPKWD